MAANRITDAERRADVQTAAEHLAAQLRYAAWELPPPRLSSDQETPRR